MLLHKVVCACVLLAELAGTSRPAALDAQRVTGVAPGTDTATAQLLVTLQPMQTIQQALKFTVVFGPPLKVEMWKGVRLNANGVKVGIPLDSIQVGESGCIFTTATDRYGNQIPGLGPITYTSSNPAVASIGSNPACPLVTVRLQDIPIPYPVPTVVVLPPPRVQQLSRAPPPRVQLSTALYNARRP